MTAKLYVSPDLIADLLFGHEKYGVHIQDATFENGLLILSVDGPLIPNGANVVDCVVHVERRKVEFHAIS